MTTRPEKRGAETSGGTFACHAGPESYVKYRMFQDRRPMKTAFNLLRRVFAPLVLGLLASACVTAATSKPSPAPPKTAVQSPEDQAADAKFAAFVRDFRAQAMAAGIRPETYDRSMDGIKRNPHVEQA